MQVHSDQHRSWLLEEGNGKILEGESKGAKGRGDQAGETKEAARSFLI